MRTRTALTASLVLVAAAGSLTPALAGGKPKPIVKEYSATASTPGGAGSQATETVCSDTVPGSTFDVEFKAPFTGRLSAKQDGFQGDWDFVLVQDGANAAESAQEVTDPINRPEEITGFKLKKGQTVTIRSCNFAGSPTAHVAYKFVAI